jgi:signal transduction histidine kinase
MEGWVRLQVHDTGVGIKPEHRTRIFAQGFTTRPDGHGFGLHSSALTTKILGGVLRADSPGEGHGATFTLDLPVKHVEGHV